ncbi:hypothetical protein K3495_g13416 [Podosphaera aphanis]|nr:hypothetical protein K3495_g13416 [Podosphaera aphanis]
MRKTPPRESVVSGSYWIRTSFLLSRVGHVSKLPRLYLGERPRRCTTPPSDPPNEGYSNAETIEAAIDRAAEIQAQQESNAAENETKRASEAAEVLKFQSMCSEWQI